MSFTVTYGLLAVVIGGLLIALYLGMAEWREELRFIVATVATTGGVASAYYVGRGLRETAGSERITRTFSYPARWGDPSWAPSRRRVGKVLREAHGKPEAERDRLIKEAIAETPGLEGEIISVLNFLEEMALAVNLDLADEAIIDRYYRSTVLRTYGLLEPWIKEHRDKRQSQRIWRELQTLHDSWRDKV